VDTTSLSSIDEANITSGGKEFRVVQPPSESLTYFTEAAFLRHVNEAVSSRIIL